MAKKTLKIKLVRSLIGSKHNQRKSAKGLGLFKRGQEVEVADSIENRGMINKVDHLVEIISK